MDLSMLKQFFCVAEVGSGQARYNPAKLTKNGMRGACDNEFDEDDEPPLGNRLHISSAEALKLCNKPFGGRIDAHVMAALKRAITTVAGKHAMCLRAPSQKKNAMMHRIPFCGLPVDLAAREEQDVIRQIQA